MSEELHNDVPHLLYQPHETQIDAPLDIPKDDIMVLRELGKRYSEIGSLSIQDKRKEMWTMLNDLQKVRPLIWMNEICWNEMNYNDELTQLTKSRVANRIERELRRTLYQWEHMQGDMIIEPIFYSPFIIENPGVGIKVVEDIAETEENCMIVSHHFHNQFETEEDLEKLKLPELYHNKQRTEDFFEAYRQIFDGILDVKKRGITGFWFSPWDDICFWMGANVVLEYLATRPDFMHKIINKLNDIYLDVLKQAEEQNLLELNNSNVRVGSGAYGHSKQLPQNDFYDKHVRPKDIWGSAAPQIFGSVSPKMHQEHSLDYEIKWLEQFGLTYYGCCEPLHDKLDVLRKIPNLRKISMSPWADIDKAAKDIEDSYVISLKPNSALLGFDKWDPDIIKNEMETKLEATKNCNVEIVLKDISTVKHEPQRLWEWTKIVTDIAKRYSQ